MVSLFLILSSWSLFEITKITSLVVTCYLVDNLTVVVSFFWGWLVVGR